MKEIAYKSRASSSKYSPVNKTDNAGRTKVPLIIIGDSCKIEFRDCSFKAHKIYKQDKSPKKITQKKHMKNNSNVSNKHKEGSASSISKNNKLGHFQDSISLAPSAIAENDGSSSKNVKNSRLLGKFFQTDKEEEQLLRENIHEVCFWMNGEAMAENSRPHDYCMRST